jgi:hypothetical protein
MNFKIMTFCENTNDDSFEMNLIKNIQGLSFELLEIGNIHSIPLLPGYLTNSENYLINNQINKWENELNRADAILICKSDHSNDTDSCYSFVKNLMRYSRSKGKCIILFTYCLTRLGKDYGLGEKLITYTIISKSGDYQYESRIPELANTNNNPNIDAINEMEWHLFNLFQFLKQHQSSLA